jgi:L-fucose mutarotase
MLKTTLLHAEILTALAAAGHGSLVLIADGNYPASTSRGPNADVVHLNLMPGVVDAVTVLEAIAGAIPVEQAYVMQPLREGPYAHQGDPEIWTDFARVLAEHSSPVSLEEVERQAFYAMVSTPAVALVVMSGETRLYANILLRIGVVRAAPFRHSERLGSAPG